MAKMWAGVTAGKTDRLADDFNSSIRFDSRMARQDITGSIAHAAMLAAKGIISEADCDALTEGLAGILEDLESKTPHCPQPERPGGAGPENVSER